MGYVITPGFWQNPFKDFRRWDILSVLEDGIYDYLSPLFPSSPTQIETEGQGRLPSAAASTKETVSAGRPWTTLESLSQASGVRVSGLSGGSCVLCSKLPGRSPVSFSLNLQVEVFFLMDLPGEQNKIICK